MENENLCILIYTNFEGASASVGASIMIPKLHINIQKMFHFEIHLLKIHHRARLPHILFTYAEYRKHNCFSYKSYKNHIKESFILCCINRNFCKTYFDKKLCNITLCCRKHS